MPVRSAEAQQQTSKENEQSKRTLRQRWSDFWGPKGTREEMSTGAIYQRVMNSPIFK